MFNKIYSTTNYKAFDIALPGTFGFALSGKTYGESFKNLNTSN